MDREKLSGIDPALIELTTDIVSAYVSNNEVQSSELPDLIQMVHKSLQTLAEPGNVTVGREPAVPIRKSITDDFLICLEDGKKFKSLKRHLRSKYDMSPDEYRDKWRLPADYPMVAPSYARQRSELAKKMGLGQAAKT